MATFDPLDACVTPVLTLDEAATHPANRERDVLSVHDGALQPMPAPRFDRTPGAVWRSPSVSGADDQAIRQALADRDGWPTIDSESTGE